VPSLELIAQKTGNPKASILARALSEAVGQYLENAKSPSRKVNEIDNRGSTFCLAMYWAQALAEQTEDASLAECFEPVAKQLAENEAAINDEMLAAQGQPADIGGYYMPDPALTVEKMRPSKMLNNIIDAV
ncbi:MAG: NADP-dependent isocitrate dehydrogenase, partial [Planctomycetota bacterium]